MRYSIEARDRIYAKGYGFLSFAKNMGKNLSNKQLLDTAKKSTTDTIKTTSKRPIQKTAEAAGDLLGNKIADKISVFKKTQNNESDASSASPKDVPKKKIHISRKKTTNY